MAAGAWINRLYYGDNLKVMGGLPSESVDLIYLDPPFNSGKNYNLIYRDEEGEISEAQASAFNDTWKWETEAKALRMAVREGKATTEPVPGSVIDFLDGMAAILKDCPMHAYLVNMAPRLVEMRRILKDTGSIYLHCDQTASHYLKVLMDAVFGARNFRNEIIWCYSTSGRGKREFSKKHDTILFYSNGDDYYWGGDAVRVPYSEAYLESHFKDEDEEGNRCRRRFDAGKWRTYYPEKGMIPNDWWEIPYVNSQAKERLGYPTQKPEVLLERIITASCPPGGLLLDPFCGTGAILVEGALVGLSPIGSDISDKMVDGARKNLHHLGLDAALHECDVGDIKSAVGRVSGIATDPPYGKSTSTQGEKIPELYERAFKSFSEVLEPGSVVAIVVPKMALLDKASDFRIEEEHRLLVHRSLTRHFCVLRRR